LGTDEDVQVKVTSPGTPGGAKEKTGLRLIVASINLPYKIQKLVFPVKKRIPIIMEK
jgi:hypothetical protein